MASGKSGLTTGKKSLLGCGGIVAVLLVWLGFWWQSLNALPVISIPNPTMPSPNAFDFYKQAGSLLMDDRKIGDAVSDKPVSGPGNAGAGQTTYTRAQKAQLVQENQPALTALRHGFAYPYQEPPMRSFMTLFPHYAKDRGLARLLSLEGQVKAAKGDWAGATASSLDAVQMGTDLPRGGPIIGKLVGIAVQAIGRRPLWDYIEHLDGKQAKTALHRLEDTLSHTVPYADTLQEEKWGIQAGLLELFRKPNWRQELLSDASGESEQGEEAGHRVRRMAQTMRMAFYGKKRILEDFSSHMDKLIANARQPYGAKLPEPPIPDDPVVQMITPVFAQADFRDRGDNAAMNGLLLLAFALRAYKAEHGDYPASLQQLVPSYLKTLPADPFAAQGTFHYRQTGQKYLLYSVGPDGKDDGGKPIDDPNQAGIGKNARYRPQIQSLGDIVAGVNTR